jgi:hypothetical protein
VFVMFYCSIHIQPCFMVYLPFIFIDGGDSCFFVVSAIFCFLLTFYSLFLSTMATKYFFCTLRVIVSVAFSAFLNLI